MKDLAKFIFGCGLFAIYLNSNKDKIDWKNAFEKLSATFFNTIIDQQQNENE